MAYGYDYNFNNYSSYQPESLQPGGMAGGGQMGPAALMVGGQFLSNYLAQKAAREDAQKKAQIDLALRQGDTENQYMQNLINNMRTVLVGGR